MKKLALVFCVLISSSLALAEVIRIDIGQSKGSSHSDLERRVYHLERAVRQLQDRIYDLESDKSKPVAANMWTCSLESMGKVHTATEPTQMAAKAKVLKICAAASNAVHCDKEDVECGN